jgi:hypothetical protein
MKETQDEAYERDGVLRCAFPDCTATITPNQRIGTARWIALDKAGWVLGFASDAWYCPGHGSDADLKMMGDHYSQG